jgi:hypothetical protein
MVLILLVASRIIVSRTQRHAEGARTRTRTPRAPKPAPDDTASLVDLPFN